MRAVPLAFRHTRGSAHGRVGPPERASESGPEPSAGASRGGPLAGVRVLELGSLIAGPFCGRILADFGAEVLKIEPPGVGDPLRTWSLVTEHGSLWALTQSRNKQSVTVDLRMPEGREIVRGWRSRARSSSRTSVLAGWRSGASASRIWRRRTRPW